jgi:hypothetical protein
MKKDKSFDAVQMMREIRSQITQETQDMSFEEQREYFERHAARVRQELGSKARLEVAGMKA